MEEQEIEELANEFSGSYWNYRWLKIEVETPEYKDFELTGKTIIEHYYELHEVYYDKDEKPFMWTENCTKFQIEDAEDLLFLVEKCLDATTRKILLLKEDKVTELDEYMDKSEVLNKLRKGK